MCVEPLMSSAQSRVEAGKRDCAPLVTVRLYTVPALVAQLLFDPMFFEELYSNSNF